MAEQNFKNHTRVVPAYHFGLALLLLLNLAWTLRHLVIAFNYQHLDDFGVALALILLFGFARRFAVTAQDRIIRLEMQLRLQRLLPAELQARAAALSLDQLIALRFAGDAEMAGLVAEVLDRNLADRKTIKARIRDWQSDHLRV